MKKTENFPQNTTRHIEDDIQHSKTSYGEWLEWRRKYFKIVNGNNLDQLPPEGSQGGHY